MNIHDCPNCACGRRAPVQSSDRKWRSPELRPKGAPGTVPGTIAWEEHMTAWMGYAAEHPGQSAQRMAERGGFSYGELEMFLGCEPKTWQPGGDREARDAANKLAVEQKKAGTYREG